MNLIPHDFTKPPRLPAAWHDRLTKWGRVALGLASKAWAKQLPIPLDARLGTLEVAYAAQALAQLPDPALAYRVMVTQSKVPTLLVMPRNLMLKLVGALVGEAGTTTDKADPAASDRELTLIEENLADYFLADCWLAFFRAAWPGDPGTWVLEEREPNPQCSRTFPRGEALLTLQWTIVGPWGESNGVWLFPKKKLLVALGDAADAVPEPNAEATSAARRDAVVQALPLVLQIVLGTTQVELSQLSRLQVGDVLRLDHGSDDGTVARIGNHNLFRGQAGRNGARKAFQIKAIVEK